MRRQILTRDDWREYEADKMLYEAYRIRDAVQKTHGMKQLVEMHVEQIRQQRRNPPLADTFPSHASDALTPGASNG